MKAESHPTYAFQRLCLWSALLLAAPPSLADVHQFPRHADYLVAEIFAGAPAEVDLDSHPDASIFQTTLREGAKLGPNFAGHYTITYWGCGSSCVYLAIVDTLTGDVFFPEIGPIFFVGIPDENAPANELDLIHSTESRLLEIHGILSSEKKAGSYYYTFENGELILLDKYVWQPEFELDEGG